MNEINNEIQSDIYRCQTAGEHIADSFCKAKEKKCAFVCHNDRIYAVEDGRLIDNKDEVDLTLLRITSRGW